MKLYALLRFESSEEQNYFKSEKLIDLTLNCLLFNSDNVFFKSFKLNRKFSISSFFLFGGASLSALILDLSAASFNFLSSLLETNSISSFTYPEETLTSLLRL